MHSSNESAEPGTSHAVIAPAARPRRALPPQAGRQPPGAWRSPRSPAVHARINLLSQPNPTPWANFAALRAVAPNGYAHGGGDSKKPPTPRAFTRRRRAPGRRGGGGPAGHRP